MKKLLVVVMFSAAAFAQGPTPCLPPYKNCTPRPPIVTKPKLISLSF